MLRLPAREKLLLCTVVAVAALFRFYRLDLLPPGLQFDQAFYVFDVIRLLQGQFHVFFAAPGGTEPLYPYLAMVGVAIFGDSALGLKLTGATLGVLTIALIYGFTRTLFQSVQTAFLAALFAALSFWHLFFNRYGERVTLLVLLTVLSFWFFWRALERRRVRDFTFTGFFTALALYTYPGARVLPVALVLLTAFAMLTDRASAARYLKGLFLALAVTAIVFLPLGTYYILHPDEFFSHPAQVSIFATHGGENGDLAAALGRNALRILGMFLVAGDGGVLRNLPGRPVFDPLMGVLFVVGVAAWLAALGSPRATAVDRKRAAFVAAWLVAVLSISLLTDDAPNFVRTLPAMPAVMILPAWGVSALWERLHSPVARRITLAALSGIVMLSAWLTYRDYFIVLANDPGTYYAFDVDKVETAAWINQNAPSQHIFLAPLLSQNGTISLLTRNARLKTFESRDTIVLPSDTDGRDALYAFPWEQQKKFEMMAERLGGLGARDILIGSNGGKLLLLYRVSGQNLPDPRDPLPALTRGGAFLQPEKIERAVWNDEIELVGSAINPAGPGGRNLEVTLFLHALKAMREDYTFSIKVRDAKERVWGQEDKWPGDNSYETTRWSVGDVVIEKFYPGLNACAPAGDYRITAEAYNPKTSRVLGLTDRSAHLVTLGTTHAEASESNRIEDLEPERIEERQIGERLRLTGYTMTGDQVRLGEGFSLALFWLGSGAGSTETLTVRLRDASQRQVTLAQTDIKIPAEGRGLCSYFDFRAPPDLEAGTATLWLNDSKLSSVTLTR